MLTQKHLRCFLGLLIDHLHLLLVLAPRFCRYGFPQLAPELLALGDDVNALGGKYHSPLQAASLNYPVVVRTMLDPGADVNACGGVQGTALSAAAFRKDTEIARLLLSRGADATVSGGDSGRSAMHAAAAASTEKRRKDTITMMDLLYEAGADVHARDNSNSTAVHVAAEGGNITALKWLAAISEQRRMESRQMLIKLLCGTWITSSQCNGL